MKSPRQRDRRRRPAAGSKALECGRRHYELRRWADACEALARADLETPLQAEDLERLAVATYLTGRDEAYLHTLERAHNAYLGEGRCARAIHCAFWLGFRLLMRGQTARASGWFGRAQRLLEGEAGECAERGYLLLPVVEQRLEAGDWDVAYAMASDAAAIGVRCGDADLIACARHQQGRIRIRQGHVEAGLALLDETMLAVTAGELSPIVTGLMYCSVIGACQQVFALDRTREWTAALAQWCEGQRDMVAFAGVCRVHRAEIMTLEGAWSEAIDEARRACVRSRGIDRRATASGFYQQAEVHRLRGEFAAAEAAYREASAHGRDPQPGLALLRLAQGRVDAAVTAIRRVVATPADRLKRLELLPAYIEVTLAAGDIEAARQACSELGDLARSFDGGIPAAIAADARGAVELAAGNAHAALCSLRCAFEAWQRIEAPYAAARARVLIGLACRALGDEDGAGLEFDAARSVFERLGATPELARIDSLKKAAQSGRPHGLTPRELQVLRLVATGETNKSIAGKLALSEKTIDRHVSNILTKLDVSSRTAATAQAYRRQLV